MEASPDSVPPTPPNNHQPEPQPTAVMTPQKQHKSPPPPPSTTTSKPRRRRIRSELDRLLSDEGTRNLLKNLKKKPTKKQKDLQQQPKKPPVFRTRVLATTATRTLNNSRVFRNGIRGRKVGRNSRGSVVVTENKVANNGPLTSSSSNNTSRSGSPSKEQTTIDYKYVSINRRNGVAFVTVTSNGNSSYASINNNVKGEDHGGGGGTSNGTSGGSLDKVVLNEGSWGLKVLQSVECAFRTLEHDNTVSVIVLQSTHSRFFCNGIDLSELLVPQNKKSSSSHFTGIVKAIKSLITTLNSARKICVASISGDCVGFGVMVLPLFDFVYASDKTMFMLKYNALGQSPEGVGLMQNLIRDGVGCSKLTNLLYLNTPLTATEAFESGLVSEILWPSRYQEELATRLTSLSSTSQLIMKTKSTFKSYRRSFKLTDLWSEFNQVESQWGSSAFQDNLRKLMVQNNHGGLQN